MHGIGVCIALHTGLQLEQCHCIVFDRVGLISDDDVGTELHIVALVFQQTDL